MHARPRSTTLKPASERCDARRTGCRVRLAARMSVAACCSSSFGSRTLGESSGSARSRRHSAVEGSRTGCGSYRGTAAYATKQGTCRPGARRVGGAVQPAEARLGASGGALVECGDAAQTRSLLDERAGNIASAPSARGMLPRVMLHCCPSPGRHGAIPFSPSLFSRDILHALSMKLCLVRRVTLGRKSHWPRP